MGPNRNNQIKEFFEFNHKEILLQSFKSKCIYSCSRTNYEINDFQLSKVHYELKVWKFTLAFFHRLKIKCLNCKYTRYLPNSFAKLIFKNGLRTDLLLKFSNDRVLSSWILNFLAKFWLLFGFILIILLITVGIRFYIEPIQLSTPKLVAFNDLKGNSNLNQIVKIKGKVDYTLAFTKDEVLTNQRGAVILSSQEVFFPLFSTDDPLDFIIIRGGKTDVSNVLGRVGVTNSDLLKNQDYEVIGRVETIDKLSNEQLKTLLTNELPKTKTLNTPQVLLNSAEVLTLDSFINRYIQFLIIIMMLFILALALQFYIDHRLQEKSR